MKEYTQLNKIILLLAVLCLHFQQVFSQSASPEWFARKCIFPMLEYDLLEVQPYAGIFILQAKNVDYEGAYIPVNLGFRKSFIQWEMLSMRFDLAFGAASYTQFEIIRFDSNTLRGGLINTDFKASGFLFAAKGNHSFRIQLFHISSHLGDDHILRNQDFELNNKTVNYEQIDFTYLYALKQADLYVGIGQVITPNSFRKRFMVELGFQGSYPIKPKLDLTLGSDMKLYDENDFIPDIHSGIGITFKQRDQHQLNLSVDTYYGSLPYSTLDFSQIFWIGLSSRIYL